MGLKAEILTSQNTEPESNPPSRSYARELRRIGAAALVVVAAVGGYLWEDSQLSQAVRVTSRYGQTDGGSRTGRDGQTQEFRTDAIVDASPTAQWLIDNFGALSLEIDETATGRTLAGSTLKAPNSYEEGLDMGLPLDQSLAIGVDKGPEDRHIGVARLRVLGKEYVTSATAADSEPGEK